MLDVSGYLITTLLLTYLIHHRNPGQKGGAEFALHLQEENASSVEHLEITNKTLL